MIIQCLLPTVSVEVSMIRSETLDVSLPIEIGTQPVQTKKKCNQDVKNQISI
jgi:hypothetical protein